MSVTVYKIGYRHGLNGVPRLQHRKGKPYDSANAAQSYEHGYSNGQKARKKVT